jgi:hypothetical protein
MGFGMENFIVQNVPKKNTLKFENYNLMNAVEGRAETFEVDVLSK